MSKKRLLYTGFFCALTVVFYLAVKKYIVYDDTITQVQAFAFTNQDGKKVAVQRGQAIFY